MTPADLSLLAAGVVALPFVIKNERRLSRKRRRASHQLQREAEMRARENTRPLGNAGLPW